MKMEYDLSGLDGQARDSALLRNRNLHALRT